MLTITACTDYDYIRNVKVDRPNYTSTLQSDDDLAYYYNTEFDEDGIYD